MKKILHVLDGLGSGGAETFIINLYREVYKELQFDFLIRNSENIILQEEIEKLGGRVFISPSFPKQIIANYLFTKRFLKSNGNEYSCIHIHMNSLIYMLPIILSEKYTDAKIIIHSHNTSSINRFSTEIHKLNKKWLSKYHTVNLACSDSAGLWMFNKKFETVYNSVNIRKFKFDRVKRGKIRAELGINDKDIVVGNVGRFTRQKNHKFLLEIYEKFCQDYPESKLLLIGEGHLEDDLKEYASLLDISDKIIFLGYTSHVEDYYHAFDIFVMPSIYEGFPISLVEAQVSGVPILASREAMSDEIKFNGNFEFQSLEKKSEYWKKDMEKMIKENLNNNRKVYYENFRLTNFSIDSLASKMKKIYLED